LLDHCFDVPPGRHYFDDFPIWDPAVVPEDPSLYRRTTFDQDRLIACAGMRLVTAGPARLPLALIGAVATDPAYRGKGFASTLVSELCVHAAGEGARFALLWGSEHRLYERLGFALAGKQIRAPLAQLSLESAPVQVLEGWDDSLFETIRNRPDGVNLRQEDLRWYRLQKSVQWYRCEHEGRITAYAAMNRGIDLQNIVHEWGGERSPLSRLLARIRAIHPQAELLGPADSPEFGLSAFPHEFLALVKPLTPEPVPRSLWIWGLDAV
jgi:predicted N-acetyltransferase YhbS